MAASGGAAIATAIANAIKANGVLVRVEPIGFQNVLSKVKEPLVVLYRRRIFLEELPVLSQLQRVRFLHKILKSDSPSVGSGNNCGKEDLDSRLGGVCCAAPTAV